MQVCTATRWHTGIWIIVPCVLHQLAGVPDRLAKLERAHAEAHSDLKREHGDLKREHAKELADVKQELTEVGVALRWRSAQVTA